MLDKMTYYPHGDSNPLHVSRKGKQAKDVAETPPEPLAHSLARESQIDPDLARLIDAWPMLPNVLRAGILAMIDASGPKRVDPNIP